MKILNTFDEKFRNYIESMNKNDFKSYSLTKSHISNIITMYNNIQNRLVSEYKSKKRSGSRPKSNINSRGVTYTTTIKSDIAEPKLRLKPNVNSPVIYRPKKGEKVKVYSKPNDTYYDVKVGIYFGYIAKGSLKEKYD